MAVVTSAVVGVASAGFSIYQSFDQKAKADRRAKEGMEASDTLIKEAEVLAEKKMLEGIQVPLEAFDNEAEQNLQSSKQIIDVLQDGDPRSLAAGAGSVAAQNNLSTEQARVDKGQLIYENKLKQAEEKQDVNQDLKDFKVGQASDQNMIARDAEEASAQATNNIVQSAGQMITSGASLVPLFPGGGKSSLPSGQELDPKLTQKLDGVSKFDSNTFSGGKKTGFNSLSEYEKRQRFPFMYGYKGD